MKRVRFPSKWLIVGAMMTFLGTSFLIIAMNSEIFGYGFHTEYTISHYVGLEIWSSLVFALSNVFVALFLGKYLWQLGEAWKMPKVYYLLVVAVAVMLLGLSACPSGMFDDGGPAISIISWGHMLTSRGMFVAMMLIAAMIVICRHANPLAHIFSVLYLIYAVVCIMGFTSAAPWFNEYVMFYETMYLFVFMLMMVLCDQSTINRINEQFNTDINEMILKKQ